MRRKLKKEAKEYIRCLKVNFEYNLQIKIVEVWAPLRYVVDIVQNIALFRET